MLGRRGVLAINALSVVLSVVVGTLNLATDHLVLGAVSFVCVGFSAATAVWAA